MAKTVGIVGAGPSGLVAAKTLLHDVPPGTFNVSIFEAQPRIGGLWPVRKDDAAGLVHPLMVANQSKHTVQFSDLAWEPDSPEFPRAWRVGQYLERYLERYCQDVELKLGTRVEAATPISALPGDGSPPTGWSLLVKSASGEVEERLFDYLLVATGYFGRPVLPSIGKTAAGIPTVHSSEYRDLQGLLGKAGGKGGKILVVGGQMSGVEIAGTIASHLSSAVNSPGPSPIPDPASYSIHHVIQRPVWVFPLHTSPKPNSLAPPFVPLDLSSYNLSNRPSPLINTQGHISPEAAHIANSIFRTVLGTDQSEFSSFLAMKLPEHSTQPYLAVSDNYLEFVRSGMIELSRGKLGGLDKQTATILPSMQRIDDIAAVVYATGFDASSSISFLPESVRQVLSVLPEDLNNTVALGFHGTHHPAVPHLGFVGFYRSPYWGVMEMQARFLAATWSAADGPSSPSLPATIQIALQADKSIERTLSIRHDPRASQFPMGDYPFLMQEFSTALSLPRHPPLGTMPPLPPASKPMDILTPARYPPRSPSAAQSAETRESLRQTHETALSALRGGRFVARAVFRSLLGRWALERDLVSKLPGHPSGHFSGTATFSPRDATADGRAAEADGVDGPGLEYLYVEEGDFRAANGLTFRATRRYVWRYDERRDKLSVWFVRTDDQKRADYLFHEIDFIVPEEPRDDDESDGRGWEAKSGHLCEADMYNVKYEFCFRAVNLHEWRIGYTVKGPKKDYTIEGVYRR